MQLYLKAIINIKIFAEVTVGFEEPSYSVNEDEGPVSVCVEVVDGGFQIPVVVTIDSSDGTATCMFIILHIYNGTSTPDALGREWSVLISEVS